jgi:phage gpG-like protein
MAGQVHLDTAEWEGFFKVVSDGMKRPQPYLKAAFATRGFSDVINHFDDEKGQEGRWAPLKPSTLARRRKGRGAGSGRILQDTGNLRRNFIPSNVEDKGATSIVFFNPTPYAATHDDGSSKRNIPQREFMWLSDKAVEDMLDIVMDLVVK